MVMNISSTIIYFMLLLPNLHTIDNNKKSKDKQFRIINGRNATKFEHPYIVAILAIPPENSDSNEGKKSNKVKKLKASFNFGAGSILGEKWVITAKHVVMRNGSGYPPDWRIEILPKYDNDIRKMASNKEFKRYTPKKIFCPPVDPSKISWATDLALLKLGDPIPLNKPPEYFQSIRIADKVNWTENIVVAGWGKSDGQDQSSQFNDLHYGELSQFIVSCPNECELMYNAVSANESNVCHGDSGGPAVIRNKITLIDELVGVTSYGDDNCAQFSGFINLTAYKDWILDIILNEQKRLDCRKQASMSSYNNVNNNNNYYAPQMMS